MAIEIREASADDLETVLDVERRAFGDEGDVIAELVSNLLSDPTAEPQLSLLAYVDSEPAGHILFTRAYLNPPSSEDIEDINMSILAPLAVVPEQQKQGIGGALISEGLRRLKAAGTSLVFVLGHIDYYPRHGFSPAMSQGFDPAYDIDPKNVDAWMVQELLEGALERYAGRVTCADTLMRPEYWVE